MPTVTADLHVHSRFSRATSKDLDLEHLWIWAQRKGIDVVGTGDFTHPGWFAELEQKLVPAGDGLLSLRSDLTSALEDQVPPSCAAPVRFMLTVEISNIYKAAERTRKVHNLVCVPDLAAAAALNRQLDAIGNIRSDGRPILGLDSRDLLEIVLTTDPRSCLVPAHIWTPWFSALGSKSGFDSIEECYRDLSPHIFAVETGLSSDPPMNWRVSSLDPYALISSSDAHSPSRLAREASLFSCEASYEAIFGALKDPERRGFEGTLEFFPEEGKYHLDGHRKCEVRLTPAETRRLGGLCPACGKPVTLGVQYRVEELADRPPAVRPRGAAPYLSLVGLDAVMSEVHGVGPGSKRVRQASERLLQKLGPELTALRDVPEEDLARAGGPALAEAIRRMRSGDVRIEGGFDGEFGRVHLLDRQERERLSGQVAMFARRPRSEAPPARDPGGGGPLSGKSAQAPPPPAPPPRIDEGAAAAEPAPLERALEQLNADQRAAVVHGGAPLVITAGPGTGKTRALTLRIAYHVQRGLRDPALILAVTFTIRAAAQLRRRLEQLLGDRASAIRVCTFHALALAIENDRRSELGQPPLEILDEAGRRTLVSQLTPAASERRLDRSIRALARLALGVPLSQPLPDGDASLPARYLGALEARGATDLDRLVPAAVDRLSREPGTLARWRDRTRMICVDEYQDVNQAQVQLVRLLARGRDLCVIGDPDQAIYSFRGADPAYFLRFEDDYPDAVKLTLERSYRTASSLLAAAQQVIGHNPDRGPGRTWSTAPGAARVMVDATETAAAEAEHVVHTVEKMVGGTTHFSMDSGRSDGVVGGGGADEISFGDIAVLYRTTAQADELKVAFERSGMPFHCPLGGPNALASVIELVEHAEGQARGTSDGRALPAGVRPELSGVVRRLGPRDALELLVKELCPPEAREAALEQARMLSCLMYGIAPRVERWGPVLRALSAGRTEADRLTSREAISLLTLHASKGLEFPVVFIVGCEEGLAPHLLPGEDELERVPEERRLFYVGMTRAEKILVLLHASHRKGARGGPRIPSRFIEEIDPDLLLTARHTPPGRRRRTQLELF